MTASLQGFLDLWGKSYCSGEGQVETSETSPSQPKIINETHYHVPRRTAEISATLNTSSWPRRQGWQSTLCPFNSPVWLLHKPDWSWGMTVDDSKLGLVVAPITAALPDVVPFLEQVNMDLNIWYIAIGLVNPYFQPYQEKGSEIVLFHFWNRQ